MMAYLQKCKENWRYYWGSSGGKSNKRTGSVVIFSQIVWMGQSIIVFSEENSSKTIKREAETRRNNPRTEWQ